ncbi:MAG: RES domain-containing protein [Kocuria sp.]|nr:RES domain-containing protein [Kocuria sp.]
MRSPNAVCSSCLLETGLKRFAIKSGFDPDDNFQCDAHGHLDSPCQKIITLSDLAAYIERCLGRLYEDPAEGVPYNSQEGGWLVDPTPTTDVLDDLGTEICDDPEITRTVGEIVDSNHGEWMRSNWRGDDKLSCLQSAWESFCSEVRQHRRYTFFSHQTEEELPGDTPCNADISPTKVPFKLVKEARQNGLITSLPKGSLWWRARVHKADEACDNAQVLGTPPAKFARDNRMSPKGVAVFSAARTPETAMSEVLGHEGLRDGDEKKITVGRFEQLRDLKVVDLTSLPKVPSIFDEEEQISKRENALLLSWFAQRLTQPLHKGDEHQQLGYIPTQIVAEIFRHAVGADGLIWRSTKNHEETVCAIFSSNEEMLDGQTEPSPSHLMLLQCDTLRQYDNSSLPPAGAGQPE